KLVESRLCNGKDGVTLLVEQRREKEEPVLVHSETTAAFADPTLAENYDLFASPQSVNHDRPLLERHSHRKRVSSRFELQSSKSIESDDPRFHDSFGASLEGSRPRLEG